MPISPAQSRAARGLLDWNQAELAAASKLHERSVRTFEKDRVVQPATVDAIERALERAGIEFIAENGGGPGVRLAKRKGKARR